MSDGLFPMRCTSCGRCINHLYAPYLEKSKEAAKILNGKTKVDYGDFGVANIRELNDKYTTGGLALTIMKINKYCCRRMFVCHHIPHGY